MFSCLYNYSGSGSIMTSPGDRRGGGQGSFVSFSEKRRRRTARRPSPSRHPRRRSPCSLLLPLPPPALLPGSGSILTSPLGEEEVRAPLPPSPRKRRRRSARRPSPWRGSPRRSHVPPVPLLHLLLPMLPPPLRSDACIVAWPHGLIVVFFPSVHSPARLPRCVR